MLIALQPDAPEADIQRVITKVESFALKAHLMPGATRTAIGVTGNTGAVDPAPFAEVPGVAECVRMTRPYKLVGRDLKHNKPVINAAVLWLKPNHARRLREIISAS
ncbi:MAG: hypothetical protein HY011_08830 [Acidobacteria bacterium]|nr:hypothetical protein [Acidobacteriota bacterium]